MFQCIVKYNGGGVKCAATFATRSDALDFARNNVAKGEFYEIQDNGGCGGAACEEVL